MAFTVSWDTIPTGDLDPDSPITTELMTSLYENGVYVKEWMGQQSTAASPHAHAGLGTDGTAQVDYANLAGTFPGFDSVGDFAASVTDTNGTGAQTFGTGALGFTPKLCIAHAEVIVAGGTAGRVSTWGNGAATDTGTSAQTHVTTRTGGADFGGSAIFGIGSSSAIVTQLDVTQFSAAGINFLANQNPGIGESWAWDVRLLVLGKA